MGTTLTEISLFLVFACLQCGSIVAAPIDPGGFEIIASDSFEGVRIVETYVDEVIPPNNFVNSNGVAVTTGDDEATVRISDAFNQHNQPVLLIEIEGGPVTIDLPESPALAAAIDGPLTTTLCPDPDFPDYPIKYCLGGQSSNLADVRYNTDAINAARIPYPGIQLVEKTPFFGYRSISIYNNLLVSRLKSTCESPANCSGDPVLLVHGYQTELSGYKLSDNGGRDYWGYFPERLTADGYTPYEFIWHTNARFTDVARDLKGAIDLIESETGKKVHIVAHSFGGILTRRLLQDTDSAFDGVELSIASVTTIGTPHLGIFDNETTYGSIKFPSGQDSKLFEFHGQISAHVVGESDFESHIASLLEFELTSGSEAHYLASGDHPLPVLKIQNLVGFTHLWTDVEPQEFTVRKGDYLIAGNAQRFLASFVFSGGIPAWRSFQTVEDLAIGSATLTEYALGRHSAEEPDLELQPDQDVVEDFVQYKHSTGTPGPLGLELLTEPYVPEIGYHDAYQRVLDWIGEEQIPPELNANPKIVLQGTNSTLSWNTHNWSEVDCTLTGGTLSSNPLLTDGGDPNIGSIVVTVNAFTTYTLTCGYLDDTVTVEIIPTGGET